MNITSAPFLFLFLPICIGLYYIVPAKKTMAYRNAFLLLASLLFYAWGGLIEFCVLLLLIGIMWLLGLWAEKNKRTKPGKRIVALAVLVNVGALFIYKYLDFTLQNIGYVIHHEFSSLGLTMPLGLSFFCFSAVSYIVDIYRGKTPAQKNPLHAALYLAVFFKITSGPIMQYNQFAPQMLSRKTTLEQFSEGFWRFCIGMGKKVLLATNIQYVANEAFGMDSTQLPTTLAWLGCIAYMLQVYFDFSGYSDMALGLGKMFGFELPENFIYPYTATSVTQYWQKWHITLGQFFRDYMFYPLTLGPAIKLRKRLIKKHSKNYAKFWQNLMVIGCIWATTGIWHGASWNYLLWGLFNGCFSFWELYRKPLKNKKLDSAFGWLYTMGLSFFTKPLVCYSNLGDSARCYATLFGFGKGPLHSDYVLFLLREYSVFLICGVLFALPIYKTLKEKFVKPENKPAQVTLHVLETVAVVAVLILSIAYVIKGGSTAFLYQKF